MKQNCLCSDGKLISTPLQICHVFCLGNNNNWHGKFIYLTSFCKKIILVQSSYSGKNVMAILNPLLPWSISICSFCFGIVYCLDHGNSSTFRPYNFHNQINNSNFNRNHSYTATLSNLLRHGITYICIYIILYNTFPYTLCKLVAMAKKFWHKSNCFCWHVCTIRQLYCF